MPSDVLLRGGSVVNVHTGEVLAGWDVAITGDRIAGTGPRGSCPVGPLTRVLDVSGQVVAPGFIDGHTHMDHPAGPSALAPWAIAGGTTARAVLGAGGGYSVVRDGQTELLPLPIGGVVSLRPIPELAAGFAALRAALGVLSPDRMNPRLTLQTLTFSAIPALRITSSGLVDVKGNRRVDLVVEA